jgi:cell division protein FtsB
MSRKASAGRGPSAARRAPARDRRSSTPRPKRAQSSAAVRRPALTGRAAILALTLAFVIVAIALPLKIWLGQRGDISALDAQIRQAQNHVSQLDAQDKKWNDPAYIESQARRRLHYVTPGQQSTVVLGARPEHQAKALAAAIAHPAAPPVSNGPWYSQLWQSMQTAGGHAASAPARD